VAFDLDLSFDMVWGKVSAVTASQTAEGAHHRTGGQREYRKLKQKRKKKTKKKTRGGGFGLPHLTSPACRTLHIVCGWTIHSLPIPSGLFCPFYLRLFPFRRVEMSLGRRVTASRNGAVDTGNRFSLCSDPCP
jgi:hypothetical protein